MSVSPTSTVPLKRFSTDIGVWPWRNSTVVVGGAGGAIHPDNRFVVGARCGVGSGDWGSVGSQVRPWAAASMASFASRSAWPLRSRGIQP